MPSQNPDSSFTDTTTISFNKLKEDIEKKNEDVESSIDKVRNSELPKTTKINHKKLILYCFLINLGWIIGIIYIITLVIHDKNTSHIPNEYLEACNSTDVISVEKYRQLKEDAAYINEEIEGIDIIIRHNLSNDSPTALQEKLDKYTDKLNSINATLTYQKESQYSCYKKALEKYLNENSDSFFTISTLLCTLSFTISFYYSIQIFKTKQWQAITIAGIALMLSLTVIILDLILVLYFGLREARMLNEFPLKNL